MIRGRRGFTLIELFVVMIVIGVLAGMALLKYIDLRHRAVSAQAISDFESIRLAAYSAWYEHGNWPEESGPGVVPAGLTSYLGQGFLFDRPEYELDWENFVPPGGGPSGGMQLGVVLTSSNTRLTNTLVQSLVGKGPFILIGDRLTYVIVGPDGQK